MFSSKNIPLAQTEQLTSVNSINVQVIERDYNGDISKAKGVTIPTGAGYAKGCLFLKDDTTSANNPWYVNQGDNATASFINGFNSGAIADFIITDGKNVVLGTTTGTKIGTVGGASGQKLAFLGSTPIVQAVLATGASHTADDIITALQNLGLVRQS